MAHDKLRSPGQRMWYVVFYTPILPSDSNFNEVSAARELTTYYFHVFGKTAHSQHISRSRKKDLNLTGRKLFSIQILLELISSNAIVSVVITALSGVFYEGRTAVVLGYGCILTN